MRHSLKSYFLQQSVHKTLRMHYTPFSKCRLENDDIILVAQVSLLAHAVLFSLPDSYSCRLGKDYGTSSTHITNKIMHYNISTASVYLLL